MSELDLGRVRQGGFGFVGLLGLAVLCCAGLDVIGWDGMGEQKRVE